MRVESLRQFLRSLAPAVESIAPGSSRDLNAVCNSLEPYAALAAADFFEFLDLADRYRKSGEVKPPTPDSRAVEALAESLASLTAATDAAALKDAQAGLKTRLDELAKGGGLKGTLKADPKWAEAWLTSQRIAPLIPLVRELAGRIASPADYESDGVRQAIADLTSRLTAADLPALAAEFGAKSKKNDAGKTLAEILVKLTGHKPGKVKAAKAEKPAPDPALVARAAEHLRGMLEKAPDPDALTDEEIEAKIVSLSKLGKPALLEVARQAGVEGLKAGDSATAIIDWIRGSLTVGKRARERNEV